MPVDHFFSGNLNNRMLATFPCDLEDHLRTFDTIYWLFWVIIWLWWDMAGHPPSLSALCWNQTGWICWRCALCWNHGPYIKGPGQKIILPIITKTNLDNLQWPPKLLNAISVCHIYYQGINPSEWPMTAFTAVCHPKLPKLAKSGLLVGFTRHLLKSSAMAMHSLMRDIHDARRVPMKRWWVALYLYRPHATSIEFRVMGLWKWITFRLYLDTHCTLKVRGY